MNRLAANDRSPPAGWRGRGSAANWQPQWIPSHKDAGRGYRRPPSSGIERWGKKWCCYHNPTTVNGRALGPSIWGCRRGKLGIPGPPNPCDQRVRGFNASCRCVFHASMIAERGGHEYAEGG
jgi:hypothetical protein